MTQFDEITGKAYDGVLFKRLLRYMRPYLAPLIVSVGLLLLVSGLRLIGPYLMKVAIDTYIAHGDLAGLNGIGAAYIGILLSIFICRYAQIFLTNQAGQKVLFDIRMAVYERLQTLSISYYDKNPVGRLITRVTNDIEALNELFSSSVVTIFGDVFILIGIMVAMSLLDWKLALVSFAVLPLLIYAAGLFRRKVRTAFRDVRAIVARLNSYVQESVSGMSVVQLFNRQKRNFAEFEVINRDHQDTYIRTIKYYALFFPAVEVISALAVGLIIWYGGGQVVQDLLTLGTLIAFIQYVQLFFQPVSNLSEQYNTLQSAMAASERLFTLLDEQASVSNPETPVVLTHPKGQITFENVWFAYNSDEWVLRDVSFVAEPGQSIAFVGATGAGKTTIISLLLRFYDPQKGRILFDGIDLRLLNQEDIRQHIGLALQDVFLFSGSVLENIRLWNTEISEAAAAASATHVNAHTFIERLPAGYQTELGERGTTLSVGQRQLISFARALAYAPTVLALDEATSSIDTETEWLIQDALDTLRKNRTSLIIAHRLSTIQNADAIIVLHKGQIQEIGTHSELLKAGNLYYRLYQLQYKDQEAKAHGNLRSASADSGKRMPDDT